jgi:hypothetical protein
LGLVALSVIEQRYRAVMAVLDGAGERGRARGRCVAAVAACVDRALSGGGVGGVGGPLVAAAFESDAGVGGVGGAGV